MAGHTQEPWKIGMRHDESWWIDVISEVDKRGLPFVACRHHDQEANARRIVASVNATAGISTEALEAGVIGELVAMLEHYEEQLCEGIGEVVGDFCGKCSDEQCAGCKAFNLLAKVKGEGK